MEEIPLKARLQISYNGFTWWSPRGIGEIQLTSGVWYKRVIELKRVIVIDKAPEDNSGSSRPLLTPDLNLKLIFDNYCRQQGERADRYTFARAYSYREVMGSILHANALPSIVVDRFILAEQDTAIELTMRSACKSIAHVASLPWITAERWRTGAHQLHFIQELGELVSDDDLVSRIEDTMRRPERFVQENDVIGGHVSELELLSLLHSLANSFSHGFCYVYTLRGDQRGCLYFEANHLVHCIFYDQVTYSLTQGAEALEVFITAVIKASGKDQKNKFSFRFFTQSQPLKKSQMTMQLKPEEAFIRAVVALENKIHS